MDLVSVKLNYCVCVCVCVCVGILLTVTSCVCFRVYSDLSRYCDLIHSMPQYFLAFSWSLRHFMTYKNLFQNRCACCYYQLSILLHPHNKLWPQYWYWAAAPPTVYTLYYLFVTIDTETCVHAAPPSVRLYDLQ